MSFCYVTLINFPTFFVPPVFSSVQQRVIGLLSEFSKLVFVVQFVIAQRELKCWVNVARWDCSQARHGEGHKKMSCSLQSELKHFGKSCFTHSMLYR